MPSSVAPILPQRVMLANFSGSSVSSDTLIRRTPAAYSPSASFASCVPLVVTTSSFNPPSPSRAPRLWNSVITSRRTSGSPPVMRILLVPSRMKAAQTRSSSSSVSRSRFGRNVMSSAMQ